MLTLLLMLLNASLFYCKILQPSLLNGKNGEGGPNAQPLVARGPKSGLVLAVNQLLEGTSGALENPRRLTIAQYQSAKVAESFIFTPFFYAD